MSDFQFQKLYLSDIIEVNHHPKKPTPPIITR